MATEPLVIPAIVTDAVAAWSPPTPVARSYFSDATIASLLAWLHRRERPIAASLGAIESPDDADQRRSLFCIKWRLHITPWMACLRWHIVVLVILAVLFTRVPRETPILIDFGTSLLNILPAAHDISLSQNPSDTPTVPLTEPLPPVENPLVIPSVEPTPDESAESLAPTESTSPIPILLDGRDIGRRDAVLEAEGGSGLTEAAVRRGLLWLQKNQLQNGSWSLTRPYRGGVEIRDGDNPIAATAMAILAFQGFGVTPTARHPSLAPFAETLARGWKSLRREQRDSGLFFDNETLPTGHRFYTHAMATIALAELAAMTRDESLHEPLRRAVTYLLDNQSIAGGWKYEAAPHLNYSDLSVTGWVVLALKTAEEVDPSFAIPDKIRERLTRFLDSVERDGGRYCYENIPSEQIYHSMTAEGIFCRLLTEPRTAVLDARLARGFEFLISDLDLSEGDYIGRNVYAWYYTTLAAHFFGGEPWAVWNPAIRDHLVTTQERNDEAGSWSSKSDKLWGASGGRLYTTVMSIMMLESYYRHRRP